MIPALVPLTGQKRVSRRWHQMVGRIISLESDLASLDDQQLHKESLALRYEVLSGQPTRDVLVRGFGLVRESAARHLGIRHYPVQLIGGIAMHHGCVAVMQTGEGKTLTATLPLYIAALAGHGAHLATANDYLAARDAKLMRPVFQALGLNTGVVQQSTTPDERRIAYAADITYSTGKEIGFDFLRDRLHLRRSGDATMAAGFLDDREYAEANGLVQRNLNFMLVDEADNILIDEARTPLIISSLPDDLAARRALYWWSASAVDRFEEKHHFQHDTEMRSCDLTPAGRTLVRKLDKPDELAGTALVDMYVQVELAILVHQKFVRDRHYVIRDGEVVIVDEFTGRMAEGRKWRTGLHQAIEAREGLQITDETAEAARITVQDLFGKYRHLCGMTGTVASSARELYGIYETPVVQVPTNRPPQRKFLGECVFRTADEKWSAIAEDAITTSRTGRPVLIGTRSIDKSELLSNLIKAAGVDHQVLNARHLASEAEIVARSGGQGKITVATNMAGRGTDIQLAAAALQAGGLHVIISELHESERIDRQLIGRCGRQGDPGSYRIYLSLEDDILRSGLGHERAARLSRSGATGKVPPDSGRLFRNAQKRVEASHYRGRRMLMHQEQSRQTAQRELGQDPYIDTIT